MTLLELAERCEKATGPDRELDISICLGIGKSRQDPGFQTAPAFTASLDAAMTLVPEGMIVALTNCGVDDPHSPNMGRATAIVGKDSDTASKPVEAASIPLALCAAALRARAATPSSNTKEIEA